MTTIPNLAGVATQDLVEKIPGGKFQASYINWSRTMNLLRGEAPGWEPHLVANKDGDILWKAPIGGFLMICFVNTDGVSTEPVPQAVMDARNDAIPWEKITARDITDTHRRGICLAAAMTFGLAYELWAKLPLESGFHHEEPEHRVQPPPPPKAPPAPSAQEASFMTKEQFKKRWGGKTACDVTNDEFAACYVGWGLGHRPKTQPMDKVVDAVLQAAGIESQAPKDSGEPTIGAMLTILGLEKEEALALFNNNTGRKFLTLRDAVARMTPDEKVKVSAALQAEIAMRAANSAADGVDV